MQYCADHPGPVCYVSMTAVYLALTRLRMRGGLLPEDFVLLVCFFGFQAHELLDMSHNKMVLRVSMSGDIAYY